MWLARYYTLCKRIHLRGMACADWITQPWTEVSQRQLRKMLRTHTTAKTVLCGCVCSKMCIYWDVFLHFLHFLHTQKIFHEKSEYASPAQRLCTFSRHVLLLQRTESFGGCVQWRGSWWHHCVDFLGKRMEVDTHYAPIGCAHKVYFFIHVFIMCVV